jgi:hypothetical protein
MVDGGGKHLLFVWKPSGYELREANGDAPAVGSRVEVDDREEQVIKIGPRRRRTIRGSVLICRLSNPRRGPSPRERTGARHGYETHDEPSRNSAITLAVPHPRRRTGARHGYARVTSASRIRYGRSSALSALMRPNTRDVAGPLA